MDVSNLQSSTAAIPEQEHRLRQILQMWKDYYDEILEMNLDSGTYESLTDSDNAPNKKGFINIEVILMSERTVHPADKDAFCVFFDKDNIRRRVENKQFVEKLNFRYKRANGEYIWIKVKNIVPTVQIGEDLICFSCFRRVDSEKGEELREQQSLNDALHAAEEANAVKSELIEKLSREIRSPLNGIIGMAGIAKSSVWDPEKSLERLEKIEKAAMKMADVLEQQLGGICAKNVQVTGEIKPEPLKTDDALFGIKSIPGWGDERFVKPGNDVIWKLPEGFLVEPSAVENNDDISDDDFNFSGKTALMAEDNELNCEIMREVLERTGLKLHTVTDGKQAVIEYVSKPVGTYDVVLMDLEMPVIDGFCATRCIRISGKDDAETIPIFAVTSRNYNEDIKKSLESGVNIHFVKPVSFKILCKHLRDVFTAGRNVNQEINHI